MEVGLHWGAPKISNTAHMSCFFTLPLFQCSAGFVLWFCCLVALKMNITYAPALVWQHRRGQETVLNCEIGGCWWVPTSSKCSRRLGKMQITFVRAVCSKKNACALGDFTGPLVHNNIKHAHSNHSLNIFSTSITGSKAERYTEIAEQMVWICRVLRFDVLPSHFAFIINQCEYKGLESRDCLFSYMCRMC